MLHSCQAQAQFVLQEGPELSCPCTAPGTGPCFQAGLCSRAEEESRAGARQQDKPSCHPRQGDAELEAPQSSDCLWGRQHFTWSHTSAPAWTHSLTLELPLWLYAPR